MLPNYYEFYAPVKIVSGQRALDNLPHELRQLGAVRPLVLTDTGVAQAGLIRFLLDAFAESDVMVGALYDHVPSDSSVAVVNELAGVFRESGCDSLVAVGGGSVIDTAKGVNIVVSEKGKDLLALSGAEVLQGPMLPLIVVPTTAGSGSEVTLAAVIADHERGVKLAFTSYHLLPKVAILDPRMTQTLPPRITAATGMDALTHAVEAYTCLQKNPLSDAYAVTAVELISRNLADVVSNGKNGEGRLAMANAACMAGIAFSNAMVGIVHTLGHATGGACGVPHGVAMNIFLPHGLEYNQSTIDGTLGQLLLPMAGPETYARTPVGERAARVIEFIRDLQRELHRLTGLPYTLEQAGVSEERLEHIAKMALGDGSIIFNPKQIDYEDALAVLRKAYS
jgi:alcohol dehydrogenase